MSAEVYYNNDILINIINELEKAKKRIYLLHFWITYKEIIDLIIKKSENGVEVIIITDHRTYLNKLESETKKYPISALEYLWDNGIEAKVFNGVMLHHKTIIIDDDILLMGSYNLYKESLHLHNEDLLIINDKKTVKEVSQEFLRIYQNYTMTKNEIIHRANLDKLNSIKRQLKNKVRIIIKRIFKLK